MTIAWSMTVGLARDSSTSLAPAAGFGDAMAETPPDLVAELPQAPQIGLRHQAVAVDIGVEDQVAAAADGAVVHLDQFGERMRIVASRLGCQNQSWFRKGASHSPGCQTVPRGSPGPVVGRGHRAPTG